MPERTPVTVKLSPGRTTGVLLVMAMVDWACCALRSVPGVGGRAVGPPSGEPGITKVGVGVGARGRGVGVGIAAGVRVGTGNGVGEGCGGWLARQPASRITRSQIGR